jgi:hypothetical protein
MADQKLYMLSVRWTDDRKGQREDVWTVLLSHEEERLLWRSLNQGIRADVIQDFYLGESIPRSLSTLMKDLQYTDLGPYVNPKSWNPGPKRES